MLKKIGNALILIAFYLGGVSTFLALYSSERSSLSEQVNFHWYKIESGYRTRTETVINLVSIIQDASKNTEKEKEVFMDVNAALWHAIEAQPITKADQLTEEYLNQFQYKHMKPWHTLPALLAVVDRYPKLKDNLAFKYFLDTLFITEGLVRIEQVYYNKAVASYNVLVGRFPHSIFFKERLHFEIPAPDGREKNDSSPKMKPDDQEEERKIAIIF